MDDCEVNISAFTKNHWITIFEQPRAVPYMGGAVMTLVDVSMERIVFFEWSIVTKIRVLDGCIA